MVRATPPGAGDLNPVPSNGYASAKDLPSISEFEDQLRTMKTLIRLKPNLQPKVRELEAMLRNITDTVDGFYAVMGGRDWIFTDHLRMDELRPAIAARDVDALEAAMIASYNDPQRLDRLIMQMGAAPKMRPRMDLVRRARDDYFDGRYYATTLVLLAVMDGFVNEIANERRGLTARDAEDVRAWDSVVGHHGGLANAQREFTRTFKATSTEEVRTLHRNGIVHGTLLNFDNITVATKAWNRLVAVLDWARSLEKAKESPKPPTPPLGESLRALAETVQRAQRLREWQPRSASSPEQLASEPVAEAAGEFFEAWQRRNYGTMATRMRDALGRPSRAAFAGAVRQRFGGSTLTAFEILRVAMHTSSLAVVTARLTLDGKTFTNETRWIREDRKRNAIPEFDEGGEWRVFDAWPHEFIASPE